MSDCERHDSRIRHNTLFFLLLLKSIDCGYSLERPRRGGSNEYLQSMF